MSSKRTFLHLSDIHFTTSSDNGYDLDQDLRNELIISAKTAFSEGAPPDAILITGDIAFKGDEAEFSTANSWLEELGEAIGVQPNSILCVPGNHDVDQRMIKGDVVLDTIHQSVRQQEGNDLDAFLSGYLDSDSAIHTLLIPLTEYNRFAATFGCESTPSRLIWTKTFSLPSGNEIRIHGLNSALFSDHRDNQYGKIPLGRFQIPKRVVGAFDVIMCHHPPDWMQDDEEIPNTLKQRAKLLLFGHKHRQRVYRENDSIVVSAGAVHPSRQETGWIPRFNILEIEETNATISVTAFPKVWSADRAEFISDTNSCDGRDSVIYEFPSVGTPQSSCEQENRENSEQTQNKMSDSDDEPISNEEQVDNNPSRILTYRFFTLSHLTRMRIVTKLNLYRDEDEGLQDFELFQRVFERARKENQTHLLWDEVENAHADGLYNTNPYN